MQCRLPEAIGDEVDDALSCLCVPACTVLGTADRSARRQVGLEGSGDAQEGGGFGQDGVAREDLGPKDDVDEAGLILPGHEGDAACGAGSLATNDQAGVAAAQSMAHRGECASIWESLHFQRISQGREGMTPRAVVGAPVVPGNLFDDAKWSKGGVGLLDDRRQGGYSGANRRR